jgi:hypothetical protein
MTSLFVVADRATELRDIFIFFIRIIQIAGIPVPLHNLVQLALMGGDEAIHHKIIHI